MPSNAANGVYIGGTTGAEAYWGSTATLVSRRLQGVEEQSLSVIPQVEAVPQVGYFGPGPIADLQGETAEFTLSGTWTYQEAPKFLDGLFARAVASSSGNISTASWQYNYSAPVISTQASATYALEFGASTSAGYRCNGALMNTLKLSGEAGGNWKFEVGGLGRSVLEGISTALSTTLAADTRSPLYPVAMKDTRLRIVPFATGVCPSSSGQVDATLISFELNVDTKKHLKQFAGQATPGDWGVGKQEGTLKLVLEFNSGVDAYVAEMVGSSSAGGSTAAAWQRIVSLQASRDSTQYLCAIHFGGIQTEPIKLWDDRDGNQTVELNLTGKFTTALAVTGTTATGNWFAFEVASTSTSTT